jgi:hypothetical protein
MLFLLFSIVFISFMFTSIYMLPFKRMLFYSSLTSIYVVLFGSLTLALIYCMTHGITLSFEVLKQYATP